MINAGANQYLKKIWPNLSEQEPCYLRNGSSMQISYSLHNLLSWMYWMLLQISQVCSCTSPLAGDIYLVFAGITHHNSKFVDFIK